MKLIINLTYFFTVLFCFSCNKSMTDYRDQYLKGEEKVYPGKPINVTAYPGNGRVMLRWTQSPDPSISAYKIYWNNHRDSLIVNAADVTSNGQVNVFVNNVDDYIYTFYIHSMDAKGNVSAPYEINNVRAYANLYTSNLYNRQFFGSVLNTANVLTLYFNQVDTTNINTKIVYSKVNGTIGTAYLPQGTNIVTINDYMPGTRFYYTSSFRPSYNAIDTFWVSKQDTAALPYTEQQLDKSKFKNYKLPGDAADAYGWVLPNVWDNNLSTGFHTPGMTAPFIFTIDLGVMSNVIRYKMWPRMDNPYGNGNPRKWIVWGTANTPAADGSTTGWTQLGQYENIKPSGQPAGSNTQADINAANNGFDFYFLSPFTPRVRYLRFQVTDVWGSGSNYFHFMELSVWGSNL